MSYTLVLVVGELLRCLPSLESQSELQNTFNKENERRVKVSTVFIQNEKFATNAREV